MGIYPFNAIVNAIALLPIGWQLQRGVDPRNDVLTYATEIRKSLENLKDPRLIEAMATNFGRVLSQSAWNKRSEVPQDEGCMVINITRRWVSGCPGMNHG